MLNDMYFIFLIQAEEVNMVRPEVSKCEGTQTKTYKQRHVHVEAVFFIWYLRKFLETT